MKVILENEPLFSQRELRAMVHEVASQIVQRHTGKDLHFVYVLEGAVHFFSDLVRAVQSYRLCGSLTSESIAVKSYDGTQSSGQVQLLKPLKISLDGKTVILVEDILDTGQTLAYLKGLLLNQYVPELLEVAVLFRKLGTQLVEVVAEYVGANIDPDFVVGYGLDCDEEHRDWDAVYVARPIEDPAEILRSG